MAREVTLTLVAQAIRRHWLTILLVTAVCTAGGAIYGALQTRTYHATATLRMQLIQAVVNTSSQYDAEVGTAETGRQRAAAAESKKATMLKVMGSTPVAKRVIDQLGDRLPRRIRRPIALARATSVSAAHDSELVRIKVRDPNPQVAALVANTWARVAVPFVEKRFTEPAPVLRSLLEAPLAAAHQAYEAAETRRQAALKTSLTASLDRWTQRQSDLADQWRRVQQWLGETEDLRKVMSSGVGGKEGQRLGHVATALLAGRIFGSADQPYVHEGGTTRQSPPRAENTPGPAGGTSKRPPAVRLTENTPQPIAVAALLRALHVRQHRLTSQINDLWERVKSAHVKQPQDRESNDARQTSPSSSLSQPPQHNSPKVSPPASAAHRPSTAAPPAKGDAAREHGAQRPLHTLDAIVTRLNLMRQRNDDQLQTTADLRDTAWEHYQSLRSIRLAANGEGTHQTVRLSPVAEALVPTHAGGEFKQTLIWSVVIGLLGGLLLALAREMGRQPARPPASSDR